MRVKDIISRVILMYHDEDYARITKYQYLQMLDDAIMQVVLVRPDSHEKRVVVPLAKGARQSLPDDAITLIDVYANAQPLPDGTHADGKPILQVSRKDLDYFSNWYSDLATGADITEFAYDQRFPNKFWVNPPVGDLPTYAELGYSFEVPSYADALTSEDLFMQVLDMEIPISNRFRTALVSYMLYLLYSTDSTSQADRQVAASYLSAFNTELTQGYAAELSVIPRVKAETLGGTEVRQNATT